MPLSLSLTLFASLYLSLFVYGWFKKKKKKMVPQMGQFNLPDP
jgi:hypothetical protein